MVEKLDDTERTQALDTLPLWTQTEGRNAITRTFTFTDFNQAFGWMTRVAMIAEQMDHHPEWANVYKTIDVTLATHSAGGVTKLDIELAHHMDRFAKDTSGA